MFSAIGAKAVMLRNYQRSRSTGEDVYRVATKSFGRSQSLENFDAPDESVEDSFGESFGEESDTSQINSSTGVRRVQRKGNYSEIRNHEYLKEKLGNEHADTPGGRAIRKVAHAAARFERGRDEVRISAFQTSSIDYANFRILLNRMFFLEFSDEEFEEICRMFDANGDKAIDGDEFIVCFTILSNHQKDIARKRQIKRRQKDLEIFLEIERKRKAAKEAVATGVADYNFSEEERASAMQKVTAAAQLYDRTHHSAKSVAAFEIAAMTPLEFRDNMHSVFDVSLSARELGAVLMHYNRGQPGDIKCADFLLDFLRIGYEYRMELRSKQIEKTRQEAEKARIEQEIKTAEQLKRLEERGADFDFNDDDVKSMKEKIRMIAKGYDRNHPAAPSLAGFDSKYLSPGLFRVSMQNTFKVVLTDKELGALTKEFDTAGRGEICNHEFLVHFIRVGYQERSQSRSKQLLKSRSVVVQEQEANERKVLEGWKIDNEKFDPNDYCEDDYRSGIAKIKEEASRYHSEHVSSPDLSLFNGADMSVAEFRDMLRRQTRVALTYQEIAALLPEIGSKTSPNMVSTAEFIIKFKAMGWKERQKTRTIQLKRIEDEKVRRKMSLQAKREKMTATLNAIVDYDFTQADMDKAVEKMTAAAYKYDKTHPSSMSLDAFMGLSMPPGLFSKMVQHTFNVSLSGKELGAIVTLYDNNGDGNIDSAEFLSNFFYMQRECRNAVRRRRLEKIQEKERARRDEELRRMTQAEEAAKQKLAFTERDQESLMQKLGSIGQKFAIDNASYLFHLQVFKGPAMNCAAFQTTFFRIFLEKLSSSEVGALMYLVNPLMANLRVMDGNKFVNMLLRLGRSYEQVLLGQLDPLTITYDSLKIAEPPSVRVVSPSRADAMKRGNASPSLPSISNLKKRDQDYNLSPSREVIVESDRSVSRGCGPEDDYSYSSRGFSPDQFKSVGVEAYFKNIGNDNLSTLSCDDSTYLMTSLDAGSLDNGSIGDAKATVHSARRLSPIQSQASSKSNQRNYSSDNSQSSSMLSSLLGQNPWGHIDKRAVTTRGRTRKRGEKLKDELSGGMYTPIKKQSN